MNQRLDAGLPKGRKRGLLIWWLFGVVAVIALATGWVLMNQSLPQDSPEDTPTAQSEFRIPAEKDKTKGSHLDLPTSKTNALPSKAETKQTHSVAFPPSKRTTRAAESPPITANPHEAEIYPFSNTKTAGLPLVPGTFPDETSQRRVHSSALPLPWLEDSGLSMPVPSDLTGAPLLKSSLPSADIDASKNVSENGFFIDLSMGTRTARPYSYVAQTGMGWRSSLSDRWSYMMTTGLGINGMHQPAQVALTEYRSSSRFLLDQSTEVSSGEFSLNREFAEARLQLKNNYFAYLGAHLDYSIHDRWSVSMGLEVAYRFHSVHEGPIQQNNGLVSSPSGEVSEISYSSREIEQRFILFNRWDIRPVAGLSYALRPHIHLLATYRHGLNPLLAHPIKPTPPGSARFLQLGVRYQMGAKHVDD